jgi:hypothetical protein
MRRSVGARSGRAWVPPPDDNSAKYTELINARLENSRDGNDSPSELARVLGAGRGGDLEGGGKRLNYQPFIVVR